MVFLLATLYINATSKLAERRETTNILRGQSFRQIPLGVVKTHRAWRVPCIPPTLQVWANLYNKDNIVERAKIIGVLTRHVDIGAHFRVRTVPRELLQ